MTSNRTKARTKGRKRVSNPTGRRQAKISLAPSPWDYGATGLANREGMEIEEAAEFEAQTGERRNPNRVMRARRVDMLEVWHRKGQISTAGFNAAEKLRDAFEATGRAPGWPDNDRVQSSPKPDHAVTIQIDRISRYHAIARLVPASDRAVIDACVLSRRTPASAGYKGRRYDAGMKHLRDALDRLAEAMQRRT